MARVVLSPDDFNDVILEYVKSLCREAYEQGVQDGRDKYDLPALLTRQHIAHEMQISLPSVDRITSLPGFTKCSLVKARYPRDAFFKFINENKSVVRQIPIPNIRRA